jgi:probable rRNA maturation factor
MTEDPDSRSSKAPDIAVAVTVLRPEWRAPAPDIERRVRDAAAATICAARHQGSPSVPGPGPVEVSVALAGDAEVRALNHRYRGIDRATNVLSFAMADGAEPGPGADVGPLLLGDVVLAYETLAREAAAQDKALRDHLMHLVVHGVLHLLGHDHAAAPEAARMERLETEILSGLGIANPYAERAGDGSAVA